MDDRETRFVRASREPVCRLVTPKLAAIVKYEIHVQDGKDQELVLSFSEGTQCSCFASKEKDNQLIEMDIKRISLHS